MSLIQIPNTRLLNQQLLKPDYKSVKELTAYMGAIQAQDFPMAKWGIGVRLNKATDAQIEEIIRTHLLRPTWHIASSDDVYWMLELSAARLKKVLVSYDNSISIDQKVYKKTNDIITKALSGGNHLAADEIKELLFANNIKVDGNKTAHYLMRCELELLICSGKIRNGKKTYAILEEMVPNPKRLSREESIITLADRYFTSRAPATIQDFQWWSGLTLSKIRKAMEALKDKFHHSVEKVNDSSAYYVPNDKQKLQNKNTVHLLPAFDEYIISYKNREDVLESGFNKKAIMINGMFKPVLLVNGIVEGIWRREKKKDKVLIEITAFKKLPDTLLPLIEKQAQAYAAFLQTKAELKLSQ